MRAAATVLLLAAGVQESRPPAADSAARAALEKLAQRLKDARTLSAHVVQSRRTDLLDTPIVSSGQMYYRRDPACLVFHLAEPRRAEVYLDRSSYQVYRPEEKRVERIDFGGQNVMANLFMVFEPKVDSISGSFRLSSAPARDGQLDVTLESSDDKVRKRLRRIVLTLSPEDGGLRKIAYADGEGDEVTLELSQVAINPELSAALFELRPPEGTRVLRRTLGPD